MPPAVSFPPMLHLQLFPVGTALRENLPASPRQIMVLDPIIQEIPEQDLSAFREDSAIRADQLPEQHNVDDGVGHHRREQAAALCKPPQQ